MAETRSLVIPSMPSCSTRRSTFRVETPLTYASSTTATIACSERRRGSRNDGKYAGPWRFLGTSSSISPTLVSHGRERYPLRYVERASGATSPSSAPTSTETSASINSRATNATASRTKSPCSPASTPATTSAAVILRPSAIVVLLLIDLREQTDE